MSLKIVSRKFKEGDKEVINDLYYAIAGRVRTVEQFNWQWLSAPGGPGSIYIIEAIGRSAKIRIDVTSHGAYPC